MQRQKARKTSIGLLAADLRKIQQNHTPSRGWAYLEVQGLFPLLSAAGEGPGDAGLVIEILPDSA